MIGSVRPPTANHGSTSVTGACRSISSRSASCSATIAVNDLPIEPNWNIAPSGAPYVREASVRSPSVTATAIDEAAPVASTVSA